jgi:hypothetical protein
VGSVGENTHKATFTPASANFNPVEGIDWTINVTSPTSIRNPQRSDNRIGIRFASNPVSDKAEIFVTQGLITRVTIYDAVGNIVFGRDAMPCVSSSDCSVTWDLRNTAGRFVASGTYLVVVETKDQSGRTQRYSAILGVKR